MELSHWALAAKVQVWVQGQHPPVVSIHHAKHNLRLIGWGLVPACATTHTSHAGSLLMIQCIHMHVTFKQATSLQKIAMHTRVEAML